MLLAYDGKLTTRSSFGDFGPIKLASVAEWTSILHLSSRWTFPDLRDMSIRRLTNIASPIEKIALARRYEVNEWLKPAYLDVCKRASTLTLAEMALLPLEDVANICRLREAARGGLIPALPEAVVDSEFSNVVGTQEHVQIDLDQKVALPAPVKKVLDNLEVVAAVERGITLLSSEDKETRRRGAKDIISAVSKSDKSGRTLRSVLASVIDMGIDSWEDSRAKVNGTHVCVTACEAIIKALGPDFKDPTLASADVQGREVIRHYITAICDTRVDRNSVLQASSCNLATSQAGLFAELFARKLGFASLVTVWWDVLNETSLTAATIRQFHSFLTTVGGVIDVEQAKDQAGEFFEELEELLEKSEEPRPANDEGGSEDEYEDHWVLSASVQPEIKVRLH
jgi:hypothetical protein